ncbi:MAG: hypothetical protein M0R40_03680 [Firmicutes bacterium]|nr:hypothetical protein [Bacillota bacterium]
MRIRWEYSKIYQINTDIVVLKMGVDGNVFDTTTEQIDVGKRALIIYYNGAVQAVYQIEQ